MKIISDKEIRFELEQIKPEGFDWALTTDSEMIKFDAIAQAQHLYTLRQVREAVAKIAHDEVRRALLNDIDIDGQFVCLAILGLIDKEMKA